jgi:hypothetical protein
MKRIHIGACVLLSVAGAVATPPPRALGQSNASPPAVITEPPESWRASKLIGVAIHNLNGDKIGTIGELLLDRDGVAKVVVINTGGFLGIGRKTIGVAFSDLKWVSHEDAAPKTYNTPPTQPPILPLPSRSEKKTPTDASRGYPDHALLNMTKAQIKAAPAFGYSRPTAPVGPAGPLNTPGGPAPPP